METKWEEFVVNNKYTFLRAFFNLYLRLCFAFLVTW